MDEHRKTYWLSRELWTLSEASALLIGVDPKNPPVISMRRGKPLSASLAHRLDAMIAPNSRYLDYVRHKEMALKELRDAVTLKKLNIYGPLVQDFKVLPSEVIRWATQSGKWPEFHLSLRGGAEREPRSSRERGNLSPLIKDALLHAKDSTSNSEVFNIMCEWARQSPPRAPLLGVDNRDIKYLNENDEAAFLSRETLTDRLYRLRKSSRSKKPI